MNEISVGISGRGWQKLRDKLGAIPPKVEEAARKHVRTAAERIQNEARSTVPVDTGELRDSITIEYSEDQLLARIGSNLVYAPVIEFSKKRGKAYLFPATENERSKFLSRMAYLTRKALRDAANIGGAA